MKTILKITASITFILCLGLLNAQTQNFHLGSFQMFFSQNDVSYHPSDLNKNKEMEDLDISEILESIKSEMSDFSCGKYDECLVEQIEDELIYQIMQAMSERNINIEKVIKSGEVLGETNPNAIEFIVDSIQDGTLHIRKQALEPVAIMSNLNSGI